MTLSLGYASLDNTSETNTGGSVAYVMGGNTIELGYQSVQTASGTADETDTTARLTTSLGGLRLKLVMVLVRLVLINQQQLKSVYLSQLVLELHYS